MLDARSIRPTTSGCMRRPLSLIVVAECTSCSSATEFSRMLHSAAVGMLDGTSRNTLAAAKEPTNTVSRVYFCQKMKRVQSIICSEGLKSFIRLLQTRQGSGSRCQPKHLHRPGGRIDQSKGLCFLPAQDRHRPVLPVQARQNRVTLEE